MTDGTNSTSPIETKRIENAANESDPIDELHDSLISLFEVVDQVSQSFLEQEKALRENVSDLVVEPSVVKSSELLLYKPDRPSYHAVQTQSLFNIGTSPDVSTMRLNKTDDITAVDSELENTVIHMDITKPRVENNPASSKEAVMKGNKHEQVKESQETDKATNLEKMYLKKEIARSSLASQILQDCEVNQRRKRHLSQYDVEMTPKRHKTIDNVDPKYSNKNVISPITPLDKVTNNVPDLTTPLHPFDTPCKSAPYNSTPLSFEDVSKDRKYLVRKSIFSTSRNSTTVINCEENSSFDKEETIEDVIAEITALCTEGVGGFNVGNDKLDKKVPEACQTIKTESNISKIDIQNIIASNKTKVATSSDASTPMSESTRGSGTHDETFVNKRKNSVDGSTDGESVGRFTNCDTSLLSSLTVIDDVDSGEITEDILGLESFEDDSEKTLVNVEGQDSLPDEQKTEENLDHDDKENVYRNRTIQDTHTELKSQDKSSGAFPTQSKLNVPETVKSTCKTDTTIRELKKDALSKTTATSFLIGGEDMLECRLKESNSIMRTVQQRWKSSGTPRPDVNLTFAATYKEHCQMKGLEPKPASLEGDHVCCLNLYSGDGAPGRWQHQSREETLRQLYHHRQVLERMKVAALNELKGKMAARRQQLQDQHYEEHRQLLCRQRLEMHQLRCSRRILPIYMETSAMQLSWEHRVQRQRLHHHHQQETSALLAEMSQVLEEECGCHQDQLAPINHLVQQLEDPGLHPDIHDPDLKYGPTVTVSLRKGPARSTGGKHSIVTMCLPALVAQAVSQEDDIYDHFYKYD